MRHYRSIACCVAVCRSRQARLGACVRNARRYDHIWQPPMDLLCDNSDDLHQAVHDARSARGQPDPSHGANDASSPRGSQLLFEPSHQLLR
jgi:hypothetical protein